jgi:hypothetical protein
MTLCRLVISSSTDILKEFAASMFHGTTLKTEAGNVSEITVTNYQLTWHNSQDTTVQCFLYICNVIYFPFPHIIAHCIAFVFCHKGVM